jgi:hypothetical protein
VILNCAPSSELTRSRVKAILESTQEFKEPVTAKLFLDYRDIERGTKSGFWKEKPDIYKLSRLQLTPHGAQLFALYSGFQLSPVREEIHALAKTRRQIKAVTDLGTEQILPGKGTVRIVEFMWFWDVDGFPNEIRDFIGPHIDPSFHKVILRKDGDVWQVAAFDPPFQN